MDNYSNVSLKKLLSIFDFKKINLFKIENTYIQKPDINRVIVDILMNKNQDINETDKIIFIPAFDCKYLFSQSLQKRTKILNTIKNYKPPLIVLSSAFNSKQIAEISNGLSKKINLVQYTNQDQEFYLSVQMYLIRNLNPRKIIHGTLVNIYGVGVLICGKSGIGKSEAAMEIIKKGHLFIADDSVGIIKFADILFGRANKLNNRFMEIRGLGIIDVPLTFGYNTLISESRIDILVNLFELNDQNKHKFDRIGLKENFTLYEGVKLPTYNLPVYSGRNTSSLIEGAVMDYKLKKANYSSAKQYLKSFNNLIKK